MSSSEFIFPFSQLNYFEFVNINQNCISSLDYLICKKYDQIIIDNDKYDRNLDPNYNHFSLFNEQMSDSSYYFVDDSSYQELCDINSSLSFCSLNINSVPHNFENFLSTCLDGSSHHFDVIGLCETKLESNIEQLYNIPNYNKFTMNVNRNSGGLVLFVSNKYINIKIRQDLNRKLIYIESLFLEITVNNSSIVVGLIYRRPNTNPVQFI